MRPPPSSLGGWATLGRLRVVTNDQKASYDRNIRPRIYPLEPDLPLSTPAMVPFPFGNGIAIESAQAEGNA